MKNQSITEAMLQFIEESPTAFHAAANVEALLLENGFEKLEIWRRELSCRAEAIIRCRTVLRCWR